MPTGSVNFLGINPASASSDSGTTTNTRKSSLDMQDFLKLLAAQLANQDVMNPMDNTEFISQMAQFTSLQTMQTLSQISYAQYGASLVGKKVVVASYNENGKYVEDKGVVDSVNFSSGSYSLVVNGKAYDLSSVMEVVNVDKAAPPTSGTQSTPASGGTGQTV